MMIPSNYDYLGWMMSALTMSNGGRYYNEEFGGEVYYDTPSMLGALTFWNDLVAKHKVHPAGEQKGPAVSTAFLSGNASMMLLSTGSLTHVRSNAKFPYKVAFVPKNVRYAVPIGGASLIIPAGVEGERQKAAWTLIKWMTAPEKNGWWSRATGYFAPNMQAYDTSEMKEFLAKNPDAKVGVDQLTFAKPWFATYKTVPVRKALEDEVQAVLAGKKQPKEALVVRPEGSRRDPEALRGADLAQAAALLIRSQCGVACYGAAVCRRAVASTDQRPAPATTRTRSPPAMARFFSKWRNWLLSARLPWKRMAARIQNTAKAAAASQVCQPTAIIRPPPSSSAMTAGSNTPGTPKRFM